jgi:prophage tail gpP-like protein
MAHRRGKDKVKIELIGGSGGGSVFENFTSFEVVNDITAPSEAAFECGNDRTWEAISKYIALGTKYQVTVNDQLRLTGRVEMSDIPLDAQSGSVVRFTIRTKLADAWYAGADPSVKVQETSLKDFILALYKPLGYTEENFEFNADVARDLLTGVRPKGGSGKKKVDLERMKVEDAKAQATESIYDAADRHLRRWGLMHWDSPDGMIVVGAPNDTQDPQYFIRMMRGARGAENNVLGATRTMDYSDVPSKIYVHGGTAGEPSKRLKSISTDSEVVAAGFYRPVVIPLHELRIQGLVDRAAAREMSARSKRKDCWEIECDGLSWWDGNRTIPWAIDSVCNIDSDIAGGANGAYYIHRVSLKRDAANGDTANISAIRRGIWRI